MATPAYPPSPTSVPAALSRVSAGYVARAVMVLIGLFGFVAVYFGIGAFLVELLLDLWSIEVEGRAGVYLLIGGTVVVAVPLLFLFKGLFYQEHQSREGMVEIDRDAEPAFFAFLDRLVAETGAPRPRRVFVSPDVNAAVFYEPSILSLVWPTQKNLVVGLGLVNHLTMSEMKAVLGHELGHFSQRAMKLGSYVYVAGRVVHNLVWGRDWLDDLIDGGKRSDIRLAVVAYLAAFVIGSIRMVLKAALWVLTLGHLSLTREMEFAADRAAVAVAGADAIARGLYKAEVADACFGVTLGRLTHAADQGLVTDDFYVHQGRALADVRRRLREPTFGDGALRHDGCLFAADKASQPSMWSTHPPSAERERAARATGVTAAADERSAWALFADPTALRRRITTELVRTRIPHAKAFPRSAEELEAVFAGERKNEERLDRYGEMYGDRLLAKLDLDALFSRTPRPKEALASAADALHGPKIAALSEDWRRASEELALLLRAHRGEIRSDAMVLDGASFRVADAQRLAEQRIDALKAIDRAFEREDQRIAEVHAEIALTLGERAVKRLRRRYADALRYGRWRQTIAAQKDATMDVVQPIVAAGQPDAAAFTRLTDAMGALDAAAAKVLAQARDRKPPRLPNVKRDTTMAAFLLDRPTAGPYETGVDGGHWMRSIFGQTEELLDKLGRLYRHAVADLLQEQEAQRAALTGEPASAPAEDAEDAAEG